MGSIIELICTIISSLFAMILSHFISGRSKKLNKKCHPIKGEEKEKGTSIQSQAFKLIFCF